MANRPDVEVRAPGPIDYVVIEFPEGVSGTATARALLDLVERGIVRLYDVMAVRRRNDGAIEELPLASGDGDLAALEPFAGARTGLLGADDVKEAGAVLDDGTVAVVVLYENTWASPFVAAAHDEGGALVASARIGAQDILDALDAVEAAR